MLSRFIRKRKIVVHITNLVRPFTNKQLLEYLKEAGEFDEESFWIDRIKSNCLVKVSLF